MDARPKHQRVVYLLLGFVFLSTAAILGFGFNIVLALAAFIAAQVAFMILWSKLRFRNRLKNQQP